MGTNTLRVFRRCPEVQGAWLYKAGPFGTVWRIHGSTSVAGQQTCLTAHPLGYLQGEWLGLALWVLALVQRHRWLRRNAERVRRRLWQQAAPLT